MVTATNPRRMARAASLAALLIVPVVTCGCLDWLECLFPGPATATVQNVTPSEANTLIEDHAGDANFVILDVRTPAEFGAGHLANALNEDYYGLNFEPNMDARDKSLTYLVHCKSGGRSSNAADYMVGVGFTDVYNMTGGYDQWVAEGYPTVP